MQQQGLVIGIHAPIVEIISAVLVERGHNTHICLNTKDALNYFLRSHVDFVLISSSMDTKDVALLKEEFQSFYEKKNKSAGPRIRKIMQLIRSKSTEIREEVQNFKSEL